MYIYIDIKGEEVVPTTQIFVCYLPWTAIISVLTLET